MLSANRDALLEVFNACSVLLDEATIELTEQEMSFRGMDAAHIALLDIHIPSSDFSTYEVKSAVKFGVRTDEATKILKRFGKEDIVKLELADNMLVLSNDVKTFKIRLIEVSASNTPMLKLKFEATIKTDRVTLDKVLGDISAVSEFVRLEGNDVQGKGDSGEVSLKPNWEVTGGGTATYSLDYLTKIVKAVSADMVTLEYGTKMPLKLQMGRIAYYLAPRVQD